MSMYNVKSRQPMDGGAKKLRRIGNFEKIGYRLRRNEAYFRLQTRQVHHLWRLTRRSAAWPWCFLVSSSQLLFESDNGCGGSSAYKGLALLLKARFLISTVVTHDVWPLSASEAFGHVSRGVGSGVHLTLRPGTFRGGSCGFE